MANQGSQRYDSAQTEAWTFEAMMPKGRKKMRVSRLQKRENSPLLCPFRLLQTFKNYDHHLSRNPFAHSDWQLECRLSHAANGSHLCLCNQLLRGNCKGRLILGVLKKQWVQSLGSRPCIFPLLGDCYTSSSQGTTRFRASLQWLSHYSPCGSRALLYVCTLTSCPLPPFGWLIFIHLISSQRCFGVDFCGFTEAYAKFLVVLQASYCIHCKN